MTRYSVNVSLQLTSEIDKASRARGVQQNAIDALQKQILALQPAAVVIPPSGAPVSPILTLFLKVRSALFHAVCRGSEREEGRVQGGARRC